MTTSFERLICFVQTEEEGPAFVVAVDPLTSELFSIDSSDEESEVPRGLVAIEEDVQSRQRSFGSSSPPGSNNINSPMNGTYIHTIYFIVRRLQLPE